MSVETYETQVGDIQTSILVYLASFVTLYYDHILTFALEVEFIWSKRNSLSSNLFIISRYFGFLSNLCMATLTMLDLTGVRCEGFRLFQQIHLFLTETLICTIIMFRVYALFSRDRRILVFCLTSASAVFSLSVWAILEQTTEAIIENPITGCARARSQNTDSRIAISWEALLAFDTLMIGLVIWKSWEIGSYDVRHVTPLPWLITRDGIMYFIVIGVLNMANIILMHIGRPFLRGMLATPTVNFSTMMLSRLLLNLHTYSDAGLESRAFIPEHKLHETTGYTERTGNIQLTELYEMTERGDRGP